MVKRLLYLNGLAIIFVVLHHAAGWGFTSMILWTDRYRLANNLGFNQVDNIEYFVLRMVDQLAIVAIPAFIFVSGYFISVATAQSEKTVGWDIVLNRIKVLIVPFVIWSVLNLLHNILWGDQYTPLDFVLRVVTGRAGGRFYFIPLLVQLYVLAPFLVFWIRSRPKVILIVSVIVQVLVLVFRYVAILHPDWKLYAILSSTRLFSAYVFWFVLGITIGLNLAYFKKMLVDYKVMILIAVFVFYFMCIVEGEFLYHLTGQFIATETLLDQLYAFFAIFAFLSLANLKLPLLNQISSLGISSFAVYLTHTFAIKSSVNLVYRFLPSMMEYQILYQLILIGGGLGFPLLLMYFVRKSPLNKYYRSIFG